MLGEGDYPGVLFKKYDKQKKKDVGDVNIRG